MLLLVSEYTSTLLGILYISQTSNSDSYLGTVQFSSLSVLLSDWLRSIFN